jgi:DNA excision repair protein ERCC-2
MNDEGHESNQSPIQKRTLMSRLTIGVREFACPLKRKGSLSSGQGSGFLSLDLGTEIHTRIQDRLRAEDPTYQAEYALQHSFSIGSLKLHVRGRCDGHYQSTIPCLEEIKSTHHLEALKSHLACDRDHPYSLQALVYAYLYWLKTGTKPKLQIRLVSAHSLEEDIVPMDFDPEQFALWIQARCEQIAQAHKQLKKLMKSRQRMSTKLKFPFLRPRPSQQHLLTSVEEALERSQQLLLQAPTGLGKTAGVLFPALRFALSRGSPVLYIAPKNSQFQAAIDLAAVFHKQKVGLKTLVLTAKAKACRQSEVLCHESMCPFSRDYHEKVQDHDLAARDRRRHVWDRSYFYGLSERFTVCPHELSLERLREADLIICDYNYVFSPTASFLNRYEDPILPMPDAVLVIDEAHNLPDRVRDAYSVVIEAATFESPEIPQSLSREAASMFRQLRTAAVESRVELDPSVVSKILALCLEALMESWNKHGFLPLDHPLFVCFTTLTALNDMLAWPRDAAPLIYKRVGDREQLKILCLDPSHLMRPLLKHFLGVIAFSATLKPFDFYRDLCGFDASKTTELELGSPFPRDNKKILIIPQVQTSLRERDKHYHRIAEIIQRIVLLRPSPSLVFVPSYQFLSRLEQELRNREPHWPVYAQGSSLDSISMGQLWQRLESKQGVLLILAVQGGSLAEGIDFRGRGIASVFIVGPALPSATFERRLMQEYFETKYQSGRPYTYTFPAMTRSVQAAGRIVRDESERGVIVLMDPRFLEHDYQTAMPSDWFQSTARELVSTSILHDVEEFWTQTDHEASEAPRT